MKLENSHKKYDIIERGFIDVFVSNALHIPSIYGKDQIETN